MFRALAPAAATAACALALAVPAAAPAAGCPAPASGARACLLAGWTVDHGEVSRVRARVTLLQRVERCSERGARRATMHGGSRKLGVMRVRATCSHRLVRWQGTFTRTDTADWTLHKGDVLTVSWGGTGAIASVKLTGSPAKK
jgi:hypothetical protein